MAHDSVTMPSGQQSGRISSWRDFEDRVGAAMAMASANPTDITMMDTDFAQILTGVYASTFVHKCFRLFPRFLCTVSKGFQASHRHFGHTRIDSSSLTKTKPCSELETA